MRHRRLHARWAAGCAAAALVFAACSTDDDSSGDDAEADSETDDAEADDAEADDAEADDAEADQAEGDDAEADDTETDVPASDGAEVATGPGVSDDAINVAVLTDLSGPFAAGAAVQVTVAEGYWDQVNADGGVCGRSVVLDVQDHGYDPQTAVSQYQNIEGDTAAVQQILGSPMVAALLPQLEEDGMYAGGMGWASVVLPSEVAQLPGASYSIQGASAIDLLVENGDIAAGDSVGVIFFEGDYGSDVAAGVEFAGDEYGIDVVEHPVTPADTDLTSQVAALQQDGAAAVVLGVAPAQLGGYAGAALSAGFEVPVVGANPVFNPSLLDTPSSDFLQENYLSITSVSPYANDAPGPQAAAALYDEVGGDAPGWEVPLAYGQALLLHVALDGACEAGDLTREGIVSAMRATTGLGTDGIFPDGLDYSTIGEPPTREVFVAAVTPDAAAGLELVEVYRGDSASAYQFGG